MLNENVSIRHNADQALEQWREEEKTALELSQLIGALRFDQNIEIVFFRHDLYDCRPSEILNIHLAAKNYTPNPITVEQSLAIVKSISSYADIKPARIDIGKLTFDWTKENNSSTTLEAFVHNQLTGMYVQEGQRVESKDVILYGFGRIGRLVARRLVSVTGRGEQLRLKAIVIRPKMQNRYEEAVKRMSVLSKDSVHGDFGGVIRVKEDGSEVNLNGNVVKLIFAKKPEDIDYTEYGIQDALLIDNTGVWRNKAELSSHMRPGVGQICLTAPAPDIPNIVYGANHEKLDVAADKIFCAASCTTNAIAPVIKVLEERFGIDKGHVETIHAYTNDQNLLDNFHKKPRRGYAAPLNMVLTSTGAAKAVAKVLPQMAGKLTGNAVRVPTPNVSLAILSLTLNEAVSRDQLNKTMQEAALFGDFVEQIDYSESTEYVSTQAVGMTSTSVIDAPSTIVSADGKSVTVYAWYDNEFGYTCQVVRLCKHAAGVRRPTYY